MKVSGAVPNVPATTEGIVWAGSGLLTLLAWLPMIQLSRAMPPMSATMGPGMPLWSFLAYWTLMTVAMMGPSLGPVLSVYVATAGRRTPNTPLVARASVFVLGYLFMWLTIGLAVFGLVAVQGFLAAAVPRAAVEMEAILLVAAGCYHLTPIQAHCLAACNRHLGGHPRLAVAADIPSEPHLLGDIRAGVEHGRDCLGACGGCMLALVAIGLMSLTWMIVFTLVVFVQKVWHWGDRLALVVGIGLLLLGIVASAEPQLIQRLSGL